MNPNITGEKEEEVVSGLRNIFSSRGVVMLQLSKIKRMVQTFNTIFGVFVGVTGAIALTIAFFLLLTSNT